MTSQSDDDKNTENPASHHDDEDDLLKDLVLDPNAEGTDEEIIAALGEYDDGPEPSVEIGEAAGNSMTGTVVASLGSSTAPSTAVSAAPAPDTGIPQVARSPAIGAWNGGGGSFAPLSEKPLEQPALSGTDFGAPEAAFDASLAPGCYGISVCFKEGSAECSTCPFAPTCGPLAKEQSKLLAGTETFEDVVRKQAKIRKRKQRDREAAAAVFEATLNAGSGPRPSRSKAMLTALQEAIANRRPSDRFLQNLTRNQKEYVIVAIIAWSAPNLSAREIAEIYTTKTGLPMNKKQAENRLARVAELVKRGIWKPFNLVRDHVQSGAD